MNMQAREVRVTFSPASGDDGSSDRREIEGPITAEVRVTVLRAQRPGRRLDSEWVGGSTYYTDRDLLLRTGSNYLVPLRRDQRLEARLAAAISDKLSVSAPNTAPSAEPDSGPEPVAPQEPAANASSS
ncbi:MAG: hypothetical protein IPJ41_03280 [Phycisphaerales bacterium]|nr:hypothetical protein [Phycisphaerales bacterium]